MKHPELTGLPEVCHKIFSMLAEHPEGLDVHQLKALVLEPGEDQSQFDRRIRQLRKYYIVPCTVVGKRHVYTLGAKKDLATQNDDVPEKTRVKVLHQSGGRCQMCGKTVAEDHVKLQVDHKIPRAWGGTGEEENLWALCEECNHGKRDYFESFDPSVMASVLHYNSPHRRIVETLHLFQGEWVESTLLEFVANFQDRQEDWQKRLRDLRYLGFIIKCTTRKKVHGGKISLYRLTNWMDGIENRDLTKEAQEYERQRRLKNKGLQEAGD